MDPAMMNNLMQRFGGMGGLGGLGGPPPPMEGPPEVGKVY